MRKLLISLMVIIALLCLSALPVLAQQQEAEVKAPWQVQAKETPLTIPTLTVSAAVMRIANIIFFATVVIAFIMVVWGGVTLATAGGDPGKVDLARHLIMYALIAIAVGAIAWGIVNLVAGYLTGKK